ncbi:hypothetical protein FA10DRAFT_262245 [Acaromyces ingoldii]|uniref:Uncharacterized protein n=1 Tax=Acaromyces ingoldii TaxID=215250 RepID=A0A316YG14_9BASI|nr:hypothetical protein FA10DRAFT_262245 [Acaromyces ingoldii]PWN87784.1 hypothetical protein FA10DRAFT_262245 [Acaromyces ingoldii]
MRFLKVLLFSIVIFATFATALDKRGDTPSDGSTFDWSTVSDIERGKWPSDARAWWSPWITRHRKILILEHELNRLRKTGDAGPGQHPKGRFRQIVEQKILKRKGRAVVQPDESQTGFKSKARRRLAFQESEDDDEDDGERTARATAMTTTIGEQNRVENRNGPRRLQRARSIASMQM